MNAVAWMVLGAALLCAGCSTIAGGPAAPPPEIRPAGGLAPPASPSAATTSVVPAGGGSESILACPSGKLEYVPLPALAAGGYTTIDIDPVSGQSKAVSRPWPGEATRVNALLTNIATNITQSEGSASGNVGGWFSASHTHKQYVIDFMKWRAEPLTTTDNVALGWVRVGAGLRLIVDITKDDGSASGSLLALAVGAKAGKVEGSISAELIGIDSKEATQAMPFTVDLSEGNIQKVIEALAIVKSKLYDNTTTVSPSLVARIQCASPAAPAGR